MIIFFLINQILFIVQNVASSILNECLEDNNEKIYSIEFLHAQILCYSFLYFCVLMGRIIQHGFAINEFLLQALLNEICI